MSAAVYATYVVGDPTRSPATTNVPLRQARITYHGREGIHAHQPTVCVGLTPQGHLEASVHLDSSDATVAIRASLSARGVRVQVLAASGDRLHLVHHEPDHDWWVPAPGTLPKIKHTGTVVTPTGHRPHHEPALYASCNQHDSVPPHTPLHERVSALVLHGGPAPTAGFGLVGAGSLWVSVGAPRGDDRTPTVHAWTENAPAFHHHRNRKDHHD